MEEDAIQPDVSQEEEKQPVLSDREKAMQQILSQLGKGEEEIPGALPTWEPVPDRSKPETAPKEEPAPVATPATVRVKEDGKEKELPIEEVVKGYQKDSVASKRLEEAARRLREVEEREAAIAERERQIAAAQVPSPVDEPDDSDEIQAAIDALVEGDNAAAAKYLRDAVKKGRQPATPALKPEEIAAQALAAMEEKQAEREHAKAIADFVKEHPLFAEPEAGERPTKERVQGDYIYVNVYLPKVTAGEISYREALNKTAEDVYKMFAPAPAPNLREERKKTIDNLPTAGSARQTQTATVETVDDVLAAMRKARGQVV